MSFANKQKNIDQKLSFDLTLPSDLCYHQQNSQHKN